MKCPYLQGKYLQSCKASKDVYVPSQFEFSEYCTNSIHTMCPLYSTSLFNKKLSPAATCVEKACSDVR